MASKEIKYKYFGDITLRTSTRCFRLASFLKCVPFEVCSVDQLELRAFKNRLKYWSWWAVTVVMVSYSIFQTAGFALNIAEHGLTTDSVIHIMHWTKSLMAAFCYVNMILRWRETMYLINQLNQLLNTGPGKYKP